MERHLWRPALLAMAAGAALGCTSVRVGGAQYGGGPEVIGRTMEVGEGPPLSDWNLTVHPRGEVMGRASTTLSWALCNLTSSLTWINRYRFSSVESGGVETGFIPEGMNEAGFTVSALTLRVSEYSNIPSGKKPEICHVMLLPYMLGTCRSVAEAKVAVANVTVINLAYSGDFMKFHYTMADAGGGHAVLEFVNREAVWSEDQVGVLTNDPTYQWHLDNLDNYVALSGTLPQSTKSYQDPHPSAQSFGTNLLGLPGDLSPPSRFVRMFFLRTFALQGDATEAGVQANRTLDANLLLAQSLLNTVYIVRGTVAKWKESAMPEMTHWGVLKIPSRRLFYVRTYSDMAWQLVDVSALGPGASGSKHLDEAALAVVNVTASFRQGQNGGA